MKTPIDKPNRRTIENLLKEMSNPPYHGSAYQKLHSDLNRLKAKILSSNAEYRSLKKKADAAEDAYHDQRLELARKVEIVWTLYRARGLTDDVLKQVEKLAEEYNAVRW